MADGKKSLVLYHDIRKPLEQLTMEQRGELFTAILDYSEHGIVPNFTGELKMAFSFIRCSIDRDAGKWEETRAKRANAGRLGGLAKVANASNAKQIEQNVANQAVNVSVPVNVNDSVPVNVPVKNNYSFFLSEDEGAELRKRVEESMERIKQRREAGN